MFISLVILFLIPELIQTCKLKFDKDYDKEFHYLYEGDRKRIDGILYNCSQYLQIKTISTTNNLLKKLSIQDVTYTLENTFVNVTVQTKLLGFANVTVHVYFQPKTNTYSVNGDKLLSSVNESCRNSLPYTEDILRNCPSLTYENDSYVLNETIQIAVKRRQTIIDFLFTAIVIGLVTCGTFCIGCGLLFEQIAVNFHRPLPVLVGLFCQFVYMPLLSYGIIRILKLDSSTSLGILSTGICPGGGASSIYTALLGLFPFWIWILGRPFIDFHRAKFPWWNMFLSFTTLFIPAMAGLVIRRYRPAMAIRVGKFLNVIGVGLLLFVLTFGVYINMFIFYIIDFKIIMASCFLPWFGFVGGALLAIVTTQHKKKSISICLESGIQNTAVSIFFLRLTFPQPEADLALTAPLLTSITTPIPFILMLIGKSIYQKCCASFCEKKESKQKSIEIKKYPNNNKQTQKSSTTKKQNETNSDDTQVR
ncbi:unnamed protein product [Didymodactylos carnosus]|uniref:Uncharacterized protein n=1 Tax=Didymodactylos carnosus TaxID=1234261 RepID=A0A813P7D9_9BILA|nr:unnamed protein product [Didymodactylos carnosus]CAF1207206.1 unnamed protein product [Didymodactylos carnosus]CAF3528575.1 unnamed protein product [Didymodactylos carnosus]CAF4016431.1 unnamed protein product [Didymodactylos carnosus]